MTTPHDKLFRHVFGQPEHAATYLGTFLPPETRAVLRLEGTRLVGASFVDEALAEREADLLLAVPLAAAATGAADAPAGEGTAADPGAVDEALV